MGEGAGSAWMSGKRGSNPRAELWQPQRWGTDLPVCPRLLELAGDFRRGRALGCCFKGRVCREFGALNSKCLWDGQEEGALFS